MTVVDSCLQLYHLYNSAQCAFQYLFSHGARHLPVRTVSFALKISGVPSFSGSNDTWPRDPKDDGLEIRVQFTGAGYFNISSDYVSIFADCFVDSTSTIRFTFL
jgi:hypothetical protein